jgi:hypothetical protein
MKTIPLSPQILNDAEIIERDPRGVKVLRLANSNILKIFRLRNAFSLARLWPYSRRFCINAKRLIHRGIPTVKIINEYSVSNEVLLTQKDAAHHHKKFKTKAVEYTPLSGQTLKELLLKDQLALADASQLGRFVAKLHQKGVHFRSLHLGNIILTPDGAMGLIDIADMKIYPWPLWFNTRIRSFRHLTRYSKLNKQFGDKRWLMVINSYLESVDFDINQERIFREKVMFFLKTPYH